MASTTNRGYGHHHQQLRNQTIRHAYGQPCHFCGQPMLPGQPLDLDHTPDHTSYRGITHASCNRADGARRGNLNRKPRQSRDW